MTKLLAIYRPQGLGSRLSRAAEEYIDEYVYGGPDGGGDYTPTECEREMLHDVVSGLFSSEKFADILQEAAAGMKAGGMDPEGADDAPVPDLYADGVI